MIGRSKRQTWLALIACAAVGAFCVWGYTLTESCLATNCAPAPRVRETGLLYVGIVALCLGGAGLTLRRLWQLRGREARNDAA